MNNLVLAATSALLLCVAQVGHSDISAEDLPSVGNLGKLLGQADPAEVEKSVYNDDGRIASGLPVIDSARGVTAEVIAQMLSPDDAELQERLEGGIEEVRIAFEQRLTEANFEVKDMGVGFAASFIVLWELASDNILPDASALELGKFLVHSFKAMEDNYAVLSADQKAQLYDYLMTTPVAFVSLVEGYTSQGATEEVESLRTKSAELFEEIFLMRYDFFEITHDGELSISAESIEQYQVKNELSDDW